jgi:hypothetical protein
MRKILILICCTLFCAGLIISCAKYKDPKPISDPRLTKHYCNDPTAVNYNWDFPGVPDNAVCFYPTDVFAGKYLFRDSVRIKSGYLFIHADSFILTINRLSPTKMSVFGFCSNGDSLLLTANPTFQASVDTTVGDSITAYGQFFCSQRDTVNGTIIENRIDSVLTINFEVASDTGVTTLHIGTATLIR